MEKKKFSPIVSGEDMISEVLSRYTEVEEVLMDSGMHCLGCFSAGFETLREACRVHGLDPAEVLEKVNKKIEGN